MEINLEPIGFVVSSFKDPRSIISACEKGLDSEIRSKIVINKKFGRGLKGLERFSHIFVIYFLHGVKKIELLTYPGPKSIKGLPVVGVFASRSQYRPNPIALRLVKLIKIEGNELHVKGLDAINNSPVLDIKPYVPRFDKPKDVRIGYWYRW